MLRCLLVCLCLPVCALADGGLPTQPYIYVQGKGTIERPADQVTLNFKLITHDAEQGAANKLIQAQAAKVFAILDQEKVAAQDVVAQDLESEAEYEMTDASGSQPAAHGKLKGYTVTRPFVVTIRDVGTFPRIVDELLALGDEEFTDISPGLSNYDEVADQARKKALADARAQADKTLKDENMKIDSVFAISPIGFRRIEEDIFGSSSDSYISYDAGSNRNSKLDPREYRLAPISIVQTMHVIYLISAVK